METMALAFQAAVLLAGRSKTPHLAVLVYWVGDPVDARISANGLVERIDQNDLIEFEDGIGGHPIRIQNTQIATASSCSLFSDRSQITIELQSLYTWNFRLEKIINFDFWHAA